MCGIIGYSGFVPGELNFQNAMRLLTRRGPDDEGSWFSADSETGLGHRRLSIIDLSRNAVQPMHNEDGTVHIVANGEIYNFKSLREILTKRGHVFVSKSDSEVVLHAYEEWGTEETLKRLDGMFALAIYDEKKKKLVLARDGIGIKPLYYWRENSKIAFSSEIQPMRAIIPKKLEIDEYARDTYFVFGYLPGNMSIYKNCKKLLPGHFIEASHEKFTLKAFWQAPLPAIGNEIKNESDAVEEVHEVIRASVESQMISDRPLGLFLSGGLDSSLVTCIAKNAVCDLRTFTVGFAFKNYDECRQARKLVSALQTSHTEFFCTSKDAIKIIPSLPVIYGEPFADSSAIPTFILSKLAKEHVSVALTGEGGDELLFGYDVYSYASKFRLLRFLNNFSLLSSISSQFFSDTGKTGKILNIISSSKSDSAVCHLFSSVFREFYYRKLRGSEWNIENSYWQTLFRKAGYISDIKTKWAWVDLQHYLVEDILNKVDRASMSSGLEVRVPLLSRNVVEKILSLPLKIKDNPDCKKWLFREILKKYVRRDLWTQKKHGLTPPISEWLRGPLNPILQDMLSPARIASEGIFNAKWIEKLLVEHKNGKADNQAMIWNILIWELWRDACKDTASVLDNELPLDLQLSAGDRSKLIPSAQNLKPRANTFTISTFSHIAGLLIKNPLVFAERTLDRLKLKFSRIPKNPIISSFGGVNFRFDFQLDAAVKQMYLGLYDKSLISILGKYLNQGDTFVDVGANIGYISAKAASFVGKTGEVHSFEPVSEYFAKLAELAGLNPEFRIFPNNIALGDKEETSEICVSNVGNLGWNTLVKSFMPLQETAKIEKIKIIRLDRYLKEKKLSRIGMIKIDVEGFEFLVLKGMTEFWENNPSQRPPLFVEISPEANLLMGIELAELQTFLEKFSYRPYDPDTKKIINLTELTQTTNVLFL